MPSRNFCSESSRQVGEELWGTATTVKVWLLLEYNHPWGGKALEESSLPQPVKDRLIEHLDAIPESRLQFIKQQGPTSGIAFFVALAHELTPLLYEFQLTTYEELMAFDLDAVVAGDAALREFIREEPLTLVCTNGKRDRCCAKHGLPVYRGMAKRAGRSVWQTTHIGGHRFAATAVFLPHGICYGRIEESDVDTLLDACDQGRIHLPRYRGRSCYSSIEQAADYFLRVGSGITDLAHFRLQKTQALGENRWAVSFAAVDGSTHALLIGREDTGLLRNESCRNSRPTEVSRYRLVDYQVLVAVA